MAAASMQEMCFIDKTEFLKCAIYVFYTITHMMYCIYIYIRIKTRAKRIYDERKTILYSLVGNNVATIRDSTHGFVDLRASVWACENLLIFFFYARIIFSITSFYVFLSFSRPTARARVCVRTSYVRRRVAAHVSTTTWRRVRLFLRALVGPRGTSAHGGGDECDDRGLAEKKNRNNF